MQILLLPAFLAADPSLLARAIAVEFSSPYREERYTYTGLCTIARCHQGEFVPACVVRKDQKIYAMHAWSGDLVTSKILRYRPDSVRSSRRRE